MGTIEIILLALTIIKELLPYVKKMVDDGKMDNSEAQEILLAFAGVAGGATQGLIIKNNPEWESVVTLIRPLLGSIFTEKE